MTPLLQKNRRKDDGPLVGLEIEAGSIAAAEVRVNGATRVDRDRDRSRCPPEAFRDGEVADPDAVAEALRALFSEHKLSQAGPARDRQPAGRRPHPAPAGDRGPRASSTRRSASPPRSRSRCRSTRRCSTTAWSAASPRAEGAPPQIDVIVVAARRDMISASLKPLRDAGLEPVGVDLSAFGMIRALGGADRRRAGRRRGAAAPAAALYCNVGDVTNLAVAKGRSCLFTRVSPVGLDDIAASLAATTGLSHEHARMWLDHVGLAQPLEQIEGDPRRSSPGAAPRSRRGAASLLDELRLSLDFYGAQEGAVAGRARRPLRARQRHPRPRRADGAGARPADRGRPAGRRSPGSTPPPPPASPSPTASPWSS